MLPVVQPSLAPHVTSPDALSPGRARIHHSSVKSVAPTSAGLAGASILILTRSMSPLPLPRNRSDVADAGPETRSASQRITRRMAVDGRMESFGFGRSTGTGGAV